MTDVVGVVGMEECVHGFFCFGGRVLYPYTESVVDVSCSLMQVVRLRRVCRLPSCVSR